MVVAMENAHNDLSYAMEVKESGFPNFEKTSKNHVFWPHTDPTWRPDPRWRCYRGVRIWWL